MLIKDGWLLTLGRSSHKMRYTGESKSTLRLEERPPEETAMLEIQKVRVVSCDPLNGTYFDAATDGQGDDKGHLRGRTDKGYSQ